MDERHQEQQAFAVADRLVRTRFEEFDLRGALLALRRRAGVILGFVVLGTALAILAATLLPKKYTATAEILVNSSQESPLNFDDINNNAKIDTGYVDSQVEILRSPSLMDRVANELQLFQDREFNSRLEDSSSFLESFDLRDWFGFLMGSGRDKQQNSARARVIDALLSSTSVDRKRLSFVVEVSATSKSPEKAAKIANAIVDQYLADDLDWRMNSLKRIKGWLSNQLKDLKEQLVSSEKAVEIFRAKNNLREVAGQTLNEEQRSKINTQLVLARAELSEMEARYQRIEDILSSTDAVKKLASLLSSELMIELRQHRAQLVQEQARLASRYGKRHPKTVHILAELRDVEQQIRAEANRIVQNRKNDVAVARTRVHSLEKSIQGLDAEAAENKQAEVQLRELERTAEANRHIYKSLLAGYERSAALTSNNSLESTARAVTIAIPPRKPSFPNKRIFAAVGFVIFGLMGLGVALLLEALDIGIHTGGQIEEKLGIPHIASLPIISRKELRKANVRSVHDYIVEKPLSSLSDAYQRCRAILELSGVEGPLKVVAIGSGLSGEGKTTFSVCLARLSAGAGLKTLLIDADLRQPSLNKVFSLSGRGGLLDVLEGRASLETAVVLDEASGAHLLVNEVIPSNPGGLLGSEAMGNLLTLCRKQYDFVVIDTAPVLPFVDTPLLTKYLDTVVFLIQWGKTSRVVVEDALRTIAGYGGHVVGAALTMVDVKRQAQYGYNYHNYYSYKYLNP